MKAKKLARASNIHKPCPRVKALRTTLFMPSPKQSRSVSEKKVCTLTAHMLPTSPASVLSYSKIIRMILTRRKDKNKKAKQLTPQRGTEAVPA